MSPSSDDVVTIALLCRGNNIAGRSLFIDRFRMDRDSYFFSLVNTSNQLSPSGGGDESGGNVWPFRPTRLPECAATGRRVNIVEDDSADRSCTSCECNFQTEVAVSSLDKGDLA